MSLLRAHSLSVAIGGQLLCAGLDFELHSGQCWGLLGTNGAGKTTLLHTLAGLRPAAAGGLSIDGSPLQEMSRKALARKLGILFQDSQDTFPATVLETVLTGRYPWSPPWAVESAEDIRIASRMLEQVNLFEMRHRQVTTLSGGERRRLAIATLLTQAPRLWLLDEPTNHLDPHQQIALLTLIRHHVRQLEGGLLMVLHDVNLVTRFCTHALLMVDAQTLLAGPVDEVVDRASLERLYRHPLREIRDGSERFYFPA